MSSLLNNPLYLSGEKKIGYMISPDDYSRDYIEDNLIGNLKYFQYDFDTSEKNDIVIFSDNFIYKSIHSKFNNVKHKIAWLMESAVIYENNFKYKMLVSWIEGNLDLFSFVATYIKPLIEKHPDKFCYAPLTTCLVVKDEIKMYKKNKLCSLVSIKTKYPNQYFRKEIAKRFKHIDSFGIAFNLPYGKKHSKGFADYMYNIAVPSCSADGYWDSHILDPISCASVPIWYGCDVSPYFNMDGVIMFSSMEELDYIMSYVGEDDYKKRLPAIEENLNIVRDKYYLSDNTLWEKYLYKIADYE